MMYPYIGDDILRVIDVMGSNGINYTILFENSSEQVRLTCTCEDGRNSKLCNHKEAIIINSPIALFRPIACPKVKEISDLFKETEFWKEYKSLKIINNKLQRLKIERSFRLQRYQDYIQLCLLSNISGNDDPEIENITTSTYELENELNRAIRTFGNNLTSGIKRTPKKLEISQEKVAK